MKTTTVTLGGGVTVDERSPDELVVISTRLALPWSEHSSILSGTAVPWRDTLWEVFSSTKGDEGTRWVLIPWTEAEVVRTSDRLDEERIAELEFEAAEEQRIRRVRDVLMVFLPVIGLLPRKIQVRLEWDYNIPAGMATVISAVVEVAAGVLLFFSLKSGFIVLPPVLKWLILLSPAMVLEGFVRIWSGLTVNEPIGSFMAAPLGFVVRGRRTPVAAQEVRHPSVHRIDDQTGALELVTDEPRSDWSAGGVLRFRGQRYRLVEKSSWQGQSLHLFELISEDVAVTLSLMPPPRTPTARDRGRGFVAEFFRFTLVAFAPRRVQEVLVVDMRLPLRLLTFVSASLEVFGGAVNLAASSFADPMALFDIGILLEGGYRLVWAVLSRAPVGSILGLPFRGIYSIWVDEVGGSSAGVSASPQKGQNRKPFSEGN